MPYQLAQLNIARARFPLEDLRMRGFVDGLDTINSLAEQAEGFVWRLKTASGNATDVAHPWSQDPMMLVNLSVWQGVDALSRFAYRSEHLEYFKRRADWFEAPSQAAYVLWWIPVGHIPSLEEAQHRLESLRHAGPTPEAFTFGRGFPPPGAD